MKKFVIITDSTSDMPKELREKYDVDYVAMNYVVDGKEFVASLDWESHSVKEFYDIMRNGKRATTTQVPQNVYFEKFTQFAKDGYDILYISCSSALSSSINTAKIVAKQVKEEYPETEILCVDSLISSLGQAHLVIMASLLRQEGKTISETAQFIEENRLKVNQCGTTDTLEYMRRAGRVKASSAFFGNLFGVKPIIISNRNGENLAVKKVKGVLASRKEIASFIKDAADEKYETLYISHADCIESAENLRDIILEVAPFKNVVMSPIGPIVGATVGPGTLICFCFGKEVTI